VHKFSNIDIPYRRQQIKDYIAAANIESALKRLIDFARDFYPERENEIILATSRYFQLQQNLRSNKITSSQASTEQTRITESILTTIDEIYEEILPYLKLEEKETLKIENVIAPGSTSKEEDLETKMRRHHKQNGRKSLKELFDKVIKDRDEIVVKAQNLTKAYKSSHFKLELDDLELRLGEITTVVGENSTGKTCLLRIIAGDLAHDKGTLQYPLFQKDTKKRLNWVKIKPQIAYVPQELPYWRGSLLNNLRFEAAIHGVKGKANYKAIDYILQRLGLAEHVHKTWQQLSGGYKLRFALAKALIWEAQLLVIDEPLAHLDIKAQLIVLKDLQNLAQSPKNPIAILISSQDLHEVEAIADNLLFMRGGKVENMGRVADLGKNRSHNVFEFACDLKQEDLLNVLADFPYHKLWNNEGNYLLSVDTPIKSEQVLQFFADKSITLNYYRNISQSIKTKFYENQIF